MSFEELLAKVQRIYASASAVQEFDMTKLPAVIKQEGGLISVHQDFTGGLSKAEIDNVAASLIYNIAHLDHHLRRWARSNGKNPNKIDDELKASNPFNIVKDLSNNDKHGYPPRGGGHSRVAPKVLGFSRVMRLSTGGKVGSVVSMRFGPGGIPRIVSSGSGSAYAVITGEVIDKDGNKLGDLYEIELEAVAALEKLMNELGIEIED